ncbi:SET domain-containing protein [Tuberibacillus calidus]|uniref:SET domain-containing protein n=1 Tax=Tuberibacillus calidus TaxID=340097 RepID=UPI0003F75610|nr:SET domain-containing protein [Tuberibacillus calidus]
MIEIKKSKYGRGVFARRDIKKGELIHVAPVIVIKAEEFPLIDKTVLSNYVFHWSQTNGDCALALGYGSLFNHSYTPNAIVKIDTEKKTINFIAYRDIKEGEEIFINYNGDPNDQSPLWFKVL